MVLLSIAICVTILESCGGSIRLPTIWPGFDSQTRRHMLIELVVAVYSALRVGSFSNDDGDGKKNVT